MVVLGIIGTIATATSIGLAIYITRLITSALTQVEKTAVRMAFVADSSGAVAQINNKIADSSREAADAVNRVTHGFEQISSVVQTTSATAEESAAASEELSGQSTMLKQLISQFKLRHS